MFKHIGSHLLNLCLGIATGSLDAMQEISMEPEFIAMNGYSTIKIKVALNAELHKDAEQGQIDTGVYYHAQNPKVTNSAICFAS